MRGTLRGFFTRAQKGLLALLFALILPFSVANPGIARASISLEDPHYLLSSTVPNLGNVYHDVNFVLPVDGPQLTPRDYVQINIPGFTNIFPFTEAINTTGTPVFSVSGHRLLITGVSALPGTRIGFSGAHANNPSTDFGATIQITKGGISGLISHEITISAGSSGNYVAVTAFVISPLSSIFINGFTGARAFVTLSRGGTAIATTSAANTGEFSFSVSGLDPGDYTFQIVSSDGQGLVTSPQTIVSYLISGGNTSINGIILSPTISISNDRINRGDPLVISGSAKPISLVSIFTESPLRSYEVTTDGDGLWSYTLSPTETQSYQPGEYRVRSVVQDSIGNRSIDSPTLTFTVLAPVEDTNNPPPTCNISKGDLNCDSKVNLTDFSILLANWKTNKKKADINSDRIVNLIDFSIMMSNFQRR